MEAATPTAQARPTRRLGVLLDTVNTLLGLAYFAADPALAQPTVETVR